MVQNEVTECPYYLISRASLAVTALLRRELAAAGIQKVRPAYLGVLMSLWREDGLRVVELGRRAGLEPSTMTSLLDRMVRDGLLLREADPEDRRAQRIYLTANGRQVEEPSMDIVEASLARAFAEASEQDIEQCKGFLRLILENTARSDR